MLQIVTDNLQYCPPEMGKERGHGISDKKRGTQKKFHVPLNTNDTHVNYVTPNTLCPPVGAGRNSPRQTVGTRLISKNTNIFLLRKGPFF